ncbi:MAG: VTT domain-containing protein [Candidatus Micrarchaeia archaeon]
MERTAGEKKRPASSCMGKAAKAGKRASSAGTGKLDAPLPLFTARDALSLSGAIALSLAAVYLISAIPFLQGTGYAGIFIISLLSSATVFLPMPGFAVVFAMGRFLNPVLVGFAAGVGSGLGEMTGYLAGYAGHNAVMNTSLFRSHKAQIEKNGMFALFLLALVPNPAFDVAGVAAGAIRMPVWKFLPAVIAGKTLRYISLAFAGGYSEGWF